MLDVTANGAVAGIALLRAQPVERADLFKNRSCAPFKLEVSSVISCEGGGLTDTCQNW